MSAATRPRRGGTRRALGCGCGSALLLLLVVAAVVIAAWLLIIRPSLRGTAREGISKGLAAQVDTIDADALPTAGTFTLTEAEINQRLAETPLRDTPVTDPEVRITPDGLRLGFTLYGLGNTLSGRPVVENGQIRMRDADLSGPAAQILSPEDAATLIEEHLNRLLLRAEARPTAIELETGRLTITTAPAPSATALSSYSPPRNGAVYLGGFTSVSSAAGSAKP